MRQKLRFSLHLLIACAALAAFSTFAHAQRFDLAAGISGIAAPGETAANGVSHQPQSLTGGAYLAFSGDFLFYKKHIGIQGEYVRREDKPIYSIFSLPYRPMFYDLNAIWTKNFFPHFTAELEGGAGAFGTRFYTGACNGSRCYATSNDFMVDFGAGVKIYAPVDMFILRHMFLRPEGRFYLINNNQYFSSNHAIRYGASIGYTF